MNYFLNKENRAKKAVIHYKQMAKEYSKEIQQSINNTVFYGVGPIAIKIEGCNDLSKLKAPIYILDKTDSVSGAFKYAEGKTTILNFASYKNPGGMFLNGSSAQEESLCHESFLYNVLKVYDNTYYEWNRKAHLNRALYMNRALYSPNIIFEHSDNGITLQKKEFDVITCAAPNYGTAAKYCNVSHEENTKVLRSRMKFIKDIAETNEVETFIFGAFGCGVFKQSADEVAQLTKEIFKATSIKRIVLPIPDDKNYSVFNKYFKGE